MFTRQNSSEHPVVTVLTRMMMAQMCYGAITFRPIKAQERGILPSEESADHNNMHQRQAYKVMRHNVSSTSSLSSFIRAIAREWKQQSVSKQLQRKTPRSTTSPTGILQVQSRIKRFSRGRFNEISSLKQLRLQDPTSHNTVKEPSLYCSLCSCVYSFEHNGEIYKTHGGSRSRNCCLDCRQNICRDCWITWHTEELLPLFQPSEEEKRETYGLNKNTRQAV